MKLPSEETLHKLYDESWGQFTPTGLLLLEAANYGELQQHQKSIEDTIKRLEQAGKALSQLALRMEIIKDEKKVPVSWLTDFFDKHKEKFRETARLLQEANRKIDLAKEAIDFGDLIPAIEEAMFDMIDETEAMAEYKRVQDMLNGKEDDEDE